jgi:hypothetical protein
MWLQPSQNTKMVPPLSMLAANSLWHHHANMLKLSLQVRLYISPHAMPNQEACEKGCVTGSLARKAEASMLLQGCQMMMRQNS